jgi:hypothetical protein
MYGKQLHLTVDSRTLLSTSHRHYQFSTDYLFGVCHGDSGLSHRQHMLFDLDSGSTRGLELVRIQSLNFGSATLYRPRVTP